MEDPEGRRARLKAMREQAEAHPSQTTLPAPPILPTPRLTNPFDDAPPTSDAQTPRFNYYSDPLAGFTNAKRKERGPVQPLPAIPPHPYPLPAAAPSGGMWQPEFHPPAGPRPPAYSAPSGGFGSPIPSFDPYPPQGYGYGPPPQPQLPQQRYGGEGGRHPERPPHSYGRGGPGRGGPWRGDGNRSGGRGGRGPKLQRTGEAGPGTSARDRPDLFYSKSMVEDPWRNLRA